MSTIALHPRMRAIILSIIITVPLTDGRLIVASISLGELEMSEAPAQSWTLALINQEPQGTSEASAEILESTNRARLETGAAPAAGSHPTLLSGDEHSAV